MNDENGKEKTSLVKKPLRLSLISARAFFFFIPAAIFCLFGMRIKHTSGFLRVNGHVRGYISGIVHGGR